MTDGGPRSAGAIAVIEIGGTSVRIGFALDGAPFGEVQTTATSRIRVADPIEALAALLRTASEEAGIRPAMIVATVPGFIDRDFDRVLHAANIPELNGRLMASELSSALGLPVRLERDVALQLLGECRAGAAAGKAHVLGVYFGTGIGAAYVGDNGVFRGGGWALEIGHMPIEGGRRALPGLLAHRLEVYASGRTLSALAEKRAIPVAELFRAAPADPALDRALRKVVRIQAYAVAGAVALLSPRLVVLGGGVLDMADYPRARLKTIIENHLPPPMSMVPFDVRWAALGERSAIHGAIQMLENQVVTAANTMNPGA
ncbi:MAG: ROK family protein [Methylobacteriaceae bacterium]|nr:ROK family protein [Methylobacteriaceae bacterium]